MELGDAREDCRKVWLLRDRGQNLSRRMRLKSNIQGPRSEVMEESGQGEGWLIHEFIIWSTLTPKEKTVKLEEARVSQR